MDSFFTLSRKFISASAGVIPLNTHHTARRGIISCLNRTFTLVLGVHPSPNAVTQVTIWRRSFIWRLFM